MRWITGDVGGEWLDAQARPLWMVHVVLQVGLLWQF